MTDNFTFRTDKRPFKNITNSLTKPLISANATSTTVKNNGTNTTSTNGDKSLANIITTAPSYTFYASRKVLERSTFVLHTSRDVLEYLQTWLGVSYPLAKLGKPVVTH